MSKDSRIELLRSQIQAIESSTLSLNGRDSESDSRLDESSETERSGFNDSKPLGNHADDEASRAFRKIVDLVNVSDRSEKALRDRLARHGYAGPAIDEAIERARSYGFVDDARFAEILIRSRISQQKGSAGIERELIGHGIDPNLVEGWPKAFSVDYETELERALRLLEARPPHSKNPRNAAYRKLAQRGFPTSVASSAARVWAASADRK